MEQSEDQMWIGAYLGAMAMITLGVAGNNQSIGPGTADTIDQSAKILADRAMKTVKEREALAKGRKS